MIPVMIPAAMIPFVMIPVAMIPVVAIPVVMIPCGGDTWLDTMAERYQC